MHAREHGNEILSLLSYYYPDYHIHEHVKELSTWPATHKDLPSHFPCHQSPAVVAPQNHPQHFCLLTAPCQSSSQAQWQLRQLDHVVMPSSPRSRRTPCLGRWQSRVLWRMVDGIRQRSGYRRLAHLAGSSMSDGIPPTANVPAPHGLPP